MSKNQCSLQTGCDAQFQTEGNRGSFYHNLKCKSRIQFFYRRWKQVWVMILYGVWTTYFRFSFLWWYDLVFVISVQRFNLWRIWWMITWSMENWGLCLLPSRLAIYKYTPKNLCSLSKSSSWYSVLPLYSPENNSLFIFFMFMWRLMMRHQSVTILIYL